jgi:hypothetical protein
VQSRERVACLSRRLLVLMRPPVVERLTSTAALARDRNTVGPVMTPTTRTRRLRACTEFHLPAILSIIEFSVNNTVINLALCPLSLEEARETWKTLPARICHT